MLIFLQFHNSLTFKRLCPPPDLLKGSVIFRASDSFVTICTFIYLHLYSHEYSIFSLAKTFNQKPHFLLQKCAKTHLQQCRISKFSGEGPPDPPLQGEGRGGRGNGKMKGRVGEGRREGERVCGK